MLRPTVLRTLARSAGPMLPRASARLPVPAVALVQPVLRLRPFSSSRAALGAGESDVELSNRLAEEIAYERVNSFGGEPDFVAEFKKAGVWSIEDKPGSDETILTRQFGSEKIQVLFSIGDLDTRDIDPEDDLNPEPEAEEAEGEGGPSFPVRLAVTVSKAGDAGALSIDAQAQDGEIVIENISFFKDAKLATALTAEADWTRRGSYVGPQFETLDENVQAQFESFLAERGLDSDFALFVPSYAEYKEQKEYCNWLENVKQFVDA